MNKKICERCFQVKNISEFSKRGSGYEHICKICRKELNHPKHEQTRKRNLIYQKQYRETHKEKAKKYQKFYQNKHKEKLIEYRKEYYKRNKERIKKYNNDNKDIIKEKRSKYYYDNIERINKKHKQWLENNKEQQREYEKNRLNIDNVYKLKVQARNMIRTSFIKKGLKKSKKTEKILGCDLTYFVNYLYETYEKNYHSKYDEKEKVDIDHIIPLSMATTEEEVIRLCHYTNLQLLKSKDNSKKGNKINYKITRTDILKNK